MSGRTAMNAAGLLQALAARLPRGHRLVVLLIPFAFLHGLFATLRWPARWATTHMVFNYHFGFGKRGLFGTLLHIASPPPYHYLTLALTSFAIFALWVSLLIAASWRLIRGDTGIAAAFVLAFLSAGFASVVSDMGYFEHCGLVLAIACMLMPPGLGWLPLRAAAALLAVLVHEANFLMLVPVMAFDAWAGAQRNGRRAGVAAAGAVLLPAAAVTAYLGNVETACDHAAAMAYYQARAQDFTIRADAVQTLCRTGADNMHWMTFLWHGWEVYFLSFALVVVLPSIAYNAGLLASLLRGRRIALAGAFAAIASPMALTVFGADLVRFVSFSQITSLLLLVSAGRRVGLPQGGTLQGLMRSPALITAIAAYEIGTALVMTDGSAMLKFPFVPLAQRLMEVTRGLAPFVVIPLN
jgi:hypothetical protein